MDAQRQGIDHPDSILVVEHPSVYTLGRGSTLENLKFDPADQNGCLHEIHRVERGGEVTWHGPGQVVCYPILDLTQHKKDLHWYWDGIESAVIDSIASFDVKGERDPAGTGVWVGGAKIAAIGLSASRWITMHGLALNINPDLSHFSKIVPCGIADRTVTSLELELARSKEGGRRDVATSEARGRLIQSLASKFGLEVSLIDVEAAPIVGKSLFESMLIRGGEDGTPSDVDRSECEIHLDDAAWLEKHQRPL